MNQMALSCFSVERHAEGLGRVDPAELVVGMREDLQPEASALERDDDVGVRVDAVPRRDLAVLDYVIPARARLHADLTDDVLLFQPRPEGRMTPRRVFHRERDAPEQRRKRERAESVHQVLAFPLDTGVILATCAGLALSGVFSVTPQSLARAEGRVAYGFG